MARNVSGQWTITQSTGHRVLFDIVQRPDGTLRGSGKIVAGGGVGREANARGRLDGDAFVFTVDWNNNGRGGQYSGRFGPTGFLSGTTVDLDNPTSGATWASERTF